MILFNRDKDLETNTSADGKFISAPKAIARPVVPKATPGVALTNRVKLNQDPLAIKDQGHVAMNKFQEFLASKNALNNPELNTTEGKKKLTEAYINEFNNSSPYVKQFPQHSITTDKIKALQNYHKAVDPSVVVDGWYGSQTSQLSYPTKQMNYMADKKTQMPIDPNGFVPVTWGNRQFKVPASKIHNYTNEDLIPVNETPQQVVGNYKKGGKMKMCKVGCILYKQKGGLINKDKMSKTDAELYEVSNKFKAGDADALNSLSKADKEKVLKKFNQDRKKPNDNKSNS